MGNTKHAPLGEKEISEQAMGLASTEQRARFVQEACGADAKLLAREQERAQALEQPDGFLVRNGKAEGPSGTIVGTSPPQVSEGAEAALGAPEVGAGKTVQLHGIEALDKRVGRYKLLQEIGEGGCGTVYMAEQIEPVRRRVALKVIKLGMDTKSVIARFEAERQALALMDHPNIAKVLDAGATDTGRPYFVMELVRGVRITQFCEEQRLRPEERLGLFVQVCGAIQHAHQKGITHRDIKPSNILVAVHEGVPVPKVIDFGIAKAAHGDLTEKTLFTALEQFLGTPAYMSPEQAGVGGLDIDTRSDIYSLGVVLYELLTGHTPFDSKALLERGVEELILTLRDIEPPTPSQRLKALAFADLEGVARSQRTEGARLTRYVRGDLDWIVMKCLEKDRTRRYDTANGLAMDILSYLADDPVVARPPSAVYRIQKFVRKHRVGVAAGAVVLLALLIGFTAATSGFIRAKADRIKAEQARVDAQQQRNVADEQKRLAEEHARQAVAEKENARKSLAMANTALAEAAYRENDGQTMKTVLNQVPPDLRDSSWKYLLDHADTSIATVDGIHIGSAAHPTRPGVFATASNLKISIIHSKSGSIESEFTVSERQRRNAYRRGLAISPDGKQLAAGSLGVGGVCIYDLENGKPLVEWDAPETDTVEFSRDGLRLLQASSIDNQVCLWDARTGRKIWEVPGAYRAVFDPTGDRVIASRHLNGRSDLVVLDAADGHLIRKVCDLKTYDTALAVSPDGQFAVTGDSDGYLRAISIEGGQFRYENRIRNHQIQYVAFSADRSQLVSVASGSGRQAIGVWDAQTGVFLHSLLGGTGKAEGLRVHPLSNDVLVTGPVTKVWSISRTAPKATNNPYSSAAFLGGDNQWLVGGYWAPPSLFNPDSTEPVWRLPEGRFEFVEISANGRVAAMAQSQNVNSDIRLFNIENQTLQKTHDLRTYASISFLRLSPDGSRLLSFIPEGRSCHYFNTQTGEALHTIDPMNPSTLRGLDHTDINVIHDLAWLGNERAVGLATLYAGRGRPESEEHLILWDAQSRNQIRNRKLSYVPNRIAAAPDASRFAEGGVDKVIRIHDASTLETTSEFRAHDDSITAVAWHPHLPILGTGSADLIVKLWDLRTGKLLEEIRGSLKPPTSLRFSPSGRSLLSVSGATVRVWEPDSLGVR